jgi:hypothetical protein
LAYREQFVDINQTDHRNFCVLDRASSWYLNKGWPTRWHCGSAYTRIPHQQASSQPTQHNKYSLAPEDGRINVWNMLSNI